MGNNYRNVMKRALIVFSLMFGLLFAAATAIVWYIGLPLYAGITVAVVIVALQYILGPYIIPVIYDVDFEPEQWAGLIKPEVMEFITKVCSDHKLPIPKIGIIDDGNPNAFVYGHFKWDARLVVTKGLLEILDEEEQKAVIAHELGHIRNNDFILMTLISLIPMIMYQIYAWTNRGNKDNLVYWVGLGAYATYIVSQYFVLGFSRIREFFADNFSKRVMGTGEPLKSALIKIAYGFTKIKEGKMVKAAAIGIANAAQSEAFFLTNYKNENEDSETYKKLMKWDTSSVWGKWYELNSTHPLTAKRILALSDGSITISKPGIRQYFRFLFEVFLKLLPWVVLALITIPNIKGIKTYNILVAVWKATWDHPMNMIFLGAAILLSYYYSYGRSFNKATIEELILSQDASPVKGKPSIIEGKVIGRGIPGLFWSEDIVLDDGTGIILVDYRQPFRFLQFLFGLFVVEDMLEKDAKVIGWYLRSSRPYFACSQIIVENKKYKSFSYIFTRILGYSALAAGLTLSVLALL